MYGVVHQGILRMVSQRLGIEAWHNICLSLGVDHVGHIISTHPYTDEQTFALLSRCAEALHLSLPDFLEQFGREWIKTGFEHYGGILRRCGNDVETFIHNLDMMHAAVVGAMPKARIGSFEILQSEPTCLVVKYKSKREDISHFVAGLLKGILDHFERSGSVQIICVTGTEMRFLITYEL